MKCIPYGDRALLVSLGQAIDPTLNQKIIELSDHVKARPGILYQIPAYSSLTIGFDPQHVDYNTLEREIMNYSFQGIKQTSARKLHVPVCYEEQFAPDMPEVHNQTGLQAEEVIQIHTTTVFSVYMMGFIPGFAYMGKLPDTLQCTRRLEPRKWVAAGSVGIAGWQTGIYPSDAPGGWQLIGKTPIDILQTSLTSPFTFQPGDEITFFSISMKEFEEIGKAVKKGTYTLTK